MTILHDLQSKVALKQLVPTNSQTPEHEREREIDTEREHNIHTDIHVNAHRHYATICEALCVCVQTVSDSILDHWEVACTVHTILAATFHL